MSNGYKNLINMLATSDWALMDCYMEVVKQVADIRSAGKEWTQAEIAERIKAHREALPFVKQPFGYGPEYADSVYRDEYSSKPSKPYAMREGIAIVPLEGVLLPKASWYQEISGAGSMQVFAQRMAVAADDSDAKYILMDVGSPGGSALGVSEAQRAVIDAKAKKPVHAYVRDMMCSGAYWIGCAADEIHIPESSVGGSIGVYQMHCDRSEQDKMLGEHWSYVSAGPRKVDGNPHEPLKGAARQAIQSRVDHIYANFVETVAKHRKLKSDDLVKATGGGDYFYGKLCLEMGLCDTNLHFEQVVARMKNQSGSRTTVSFASADKTASAQSVERPTEATVSQDAGASISNAPATREEGQVDKDLKLCLFALGIVKSQDASDEAARAALEAWAMASGVTLPEGDDKIKTLFVERARAGFRPQSVATTESKPHVELDEAAIEARVEKRRKELIATAANLNDAGIRVSADQVEEAISKKVDPAAAAQSWINAPRLGIDGAPEGRRLNVRVTQDAGDALTEPVSQALCFAMGGSEQGGKINGAEISQEARYYASRGLAYIAEKVCEQTGGRFLSKEEQAKHFLRVTSGTKDKPIRIANPLTYMEQQAGMVSGAQPAYTPGTLPAAFAAPMRQRILRAMQSVPVTYSKIGKRWEDASNFDGEELVFYSAKGRLPEREDGRPRKQGEQMAVRPAWWRVREFGDEARLTWQTVISGKLQRFNSQIQDKQWGHEQTINEFAVQGVTGNPMMFDGYNLFQTANQSSGGKVVRFLNAIAGGSGGSITVPQMTLMDNAMVVQKDFDNKSTMGLQPKCIWVPNKHRIPAGQFSYFSNGPQNQTASSPSAVSVWKTVDAYWDPMLDDVNADQWYAFADPEVCPVVVYQFLEGHGPGGVWEMYYDPDTSSQVYAIRGVFAVAIVRWHGVARNSGGV